MADTYPKNTIDDDGLKKVWDMVMDRLGLKVDKEAGKGLSTNDYTTTEKNKLAGIASGAEVNTVTSVAGKTGAVTLNKSDVGLDNVGNFKAVSTSANQGLTNTEKSNARANIDTPSNGDIQSSKTIKSSVVTVTDAAPINAEDITVDIEPIQDLHGYDRPWAGGAGKNKLPMTVTGIKAANTSGTWSGNAYTLSGVTFTLLTDSDGNVNGIKVNGTSTDNTYLVLDGNFDSNALASCIANGLSGIPGSIKFRISNQSNFVSIQDVYEGTVIASNGSGLRYSIRVELGTAVTNRIIYPMIRLSTETDATFAPYSNICPIEGRTDAVLDRVGKNRYPILIGDDAFNNNASGTHSRGANGELIVTCASGSNASGAYANANSTFREVLKALAPCYVSFDIKGSTNATVEVGKVGNSVAVTTQTQRVSLLYNAGEYTFVAYGKGNAITLTISNMMVSLTQPTAYEPYQGEQYTASFGETVYGGKWHVTKGGTDKTHANIANYNVETINEPWLSSMDEYSPGATPTTGAQVVYPLTTPTTISTPKQNVPMLQGINTVSADCGDTQLKYQPDNVIGELKGEIQKANSFVAKMALRQGSGAKDFSYGGWSFRIRIFRSMGQISLYVENISASNVTEQAIVKVFMGDSDYRAPEELRPRMNIVQAATYTTPSGWAIQVYLKDDGYIMLTGIAPEAGASAPTRTNWNLVEPWLAHQQAMDLFNN